MVLRVENEMNEMRKECASDRVTHTTRITVTASESERDDRREREHKDFSTSRWLENCTDLETRQQKYRGDRRGEITFNDRE